MERVTQVLLYRSLTAIWLLPAAAAHCAGSKREPFPRAVCAQALSLWRGKASWLSAVRSVRARSSLDGPFSSSWRKRRVICWSWGLWLLTRLCLDEFLIANPRLEVLEHALSKTRSSIPPQAPSGSDHKEQKSIFFPFGENFNGIVLVVEDLHCCGKTRLCMHCGGGPRTSHFSPWVLQFPIHSHMWVLQCSAPAEAC